MIASPPKCSLVSTNGPSVKTGVSSSGTTLQIAVEASRPPWEKTKTPASTISAQTARPRLPRSPNVSPDMSGVHSSLNAIMYSGISKLLWCARSPDGCPSTSPRTACRRSDSLPELFSSHR